MYVKEIVDYLDEVFDEDLGLLVQDGSISEVSEQFLALFKACKNGDFSMVQQLASVAANAASQSAVRTQASSMSTAESDDDDGDDDDVDGEGDEELSKEHEVDEDGFTVYRRKK